MPLKITLITPPDIFENLNTSILLMDLSEAEQDQASGLLGKFDSEESFNIYFYQGEPSIPWLLHALSRSQYKYINLDNGYGISAKMHGYILGNGSVYYTTADKNLKDIYSFINNNYVSSIGDFFERVLDGKR